MPNHWLPVINADIVSFDPLAEDWEKEMKQILNDLINE